MEAAWARLHTLTGADAPQDIIAYWEGVHPSLGCEFYQAAGEQASPDGMPATHVCGMEYHSITTTPVYRSATDSLADLCILLLGHCADTQGKRSRHHTCATAQRLAHCQLCVLWQGSLACCCGGSVVACAYRYGIGGKHA